MSIGALCLSLSIAQTTLAQEAPRTAPPGYKEVSSDRGVALWRKGREYVQVISPARGARMQFLHGDVLPSEGQATSFERKKIEQWWEEWKEHNPAAFSMTNGQFFNMNDSSKAPLAFSTKIDDVVYTGYGDATEYQEGKLLLLVGERKAAMVEYNDDAAQLYEHTEEEAIVGLKPEIDKSRNRRLGRTFVGVMRNGNIILFTSPTATQRYATRIILAFGADRRKVMMLDGGASTQLATHDGRIIPGNRPSDPAQRAVPQAIGVLAGGN